MMKNERVVRSEVLPGYITQQCFLEPSVLLARRRYLSE